MTRSVTDNRTIHMDQYGQMDQSSGHKRVSVRIYFYGPLSNGHTDHPNGHVRTCGPTMWTTVDRHSGHNTDKWTNLVDINGRVDQFSGHKWTIFGKDGNHFRLFLIFRPFSCNHSGEKKIYFIKNEFPSPLYRLLIYAPFYPVFH